MNVVTRGVRNAFRNRIRTFSIVIILSLSIGLALTMMVARQTVEAKIASVKSSIGNTISISPAGARGFDGGGEPITDAQMVKVSSVAHVVSVAKSLQDRLTTANTNLASAIEAGSIGRRNNPGSGSGASLNTDGPRPGGGNFTPPVELIGTSTLAGSVLNGGGSISMTSGSQIDPDKDENVALVGKTLAAKNSLSPGSTFTAYATTVTVAGIFDSGNNFSNNTVVMSLPAVQRLSNQAGQLSNATVQVDSITNVDGAVTAIKNVLGSGVADVISQQSTASQALSPLENIKSISLYSLVGAVGAGAVIILLTMMMIVRERRREIGVLKAIGASNIKVVTQFVSEAVTLTMIAAVVGLGISIAAANPVTQALATNSANTVQQSGPVGPGPGGPGGPVRGFARAANIGGQNLRNLQAAVGWDILLWGLAAALIIAVLGSAVPAFLISKVRPAEVMRAE